MQCATGVGCWGSSPQAAAPPSGQPVTTIRRAGADGVGLIVVPVAFVSEHSETLVELDIEYRHLAQQAGVPRYIRVATVGTAPAFIAGLARLVRAVQQKTRDTPCPSDGGRLCPPSHGRCPCGATAQVGA